MHGARWSRCQLRVHVLGLVSQLGPEQAGLTRVDLPHLDKSSWSTLYALYCAGQTADS